MAGAGFARIIAACNYVTYVVPRGKDDLVVVVVEAAL